jgi:hypothetical protein
MKQCWLTHKFYFDHGDQTLHAIQPPQLRGADSVLMKKGDGQGSLLSLSFPGTNHSVPAWRARLEIPIDILLGAKGTSFIHKIWLHSA